MGVEQWKPLDGYGIRYSISNRGRVRKDGQVINGRRYREIILSPNEEGMVWLNGAQVPISALMRGRWPYEVPEPEKRSRRKVRVLEEGERRRMSDLTITERLQVLEAYKTASRVTVAKRFNCNLNAVSMIARKYGLNKKEK